MCLQMDISHIGVVYNGYTTYWIYYILHISPTGQLHSGYLYPGDYYYTVDILCGGLDGIYRSI